MNALVLDQLSKSFAGLAAVKSLSVTIRAGERVALLGPNGAGKTTVFNLITGLLRPSSGAIWVLGTNVTTLPIRQRARLGLSRTFQVTALFPDLTVLQTTILGIQARRRLKWVSYRSLSAFPEVEGVAKELLASWELESLANERVANLSYGDCRVLEIVLSLATGPRLILLDEPTAGLSAAETTRITELVKRLDPTLTIVVIEHDLDVAFEVAARVIVLDQGRLLADGPSDIVRRDARVMAAYFGDAAP